jgi:hypothetical protein
MFLCFFLWGRNLFIFQDKFIPPEVVIGLVLNLIEEFRCETKIPKQHKPFMHDSLEGIPWGFFNGASQGNLP